VNPTAAVISVTELRNALRCPRAFVLGRLLRKAVAFPLGSSCLGASFHRVVDRFARTVLTPPGELAARDAGDPEAGPALTRWIMGLLIRELQADPGYASIPAEVDDLAEACRQFSAHVALRVGGFAGPVAEVLPRLLRQGEHPVDAAFPEAGVLLRGRIDALFGNRAGDLEVVEYKLTDEANAPLDHAQVALYRELLMRSQGLDALPVILRFGPECSLVQIPREQADRLVQTELVPLLRRMRDWLDRPGPVPPTDCRALCAVCPVQRACADRYPQHLGFRDDPPAVACRPRPALDGPLVAAQPRAQAFVVPEGPEGVREAARLRARILEEFHRDGIPVQAPDPVVGPRLYVIPVSRPSGPVTGMDRVAEDVRHRLATTDGVEVEYARVGAKREFLVLRAQPRELALGPLLAAKAQWLSERPGRFVVGQEPGGRILTADLADPATPHLLIGGGAGSGKSWLLKAIVASLVHFHDPSQLRLTLLDPKRVTFIGSEFQSAISAHRDGPVLFGIEDAMPCFNHYIGVMEERYERFEAVKAADLLEYNLAVDPDRRLPRHVIVMDEFQDLTADRKAAQDFRGAVSRLGAKARAAGVHLILATQRPDKDTVDPSIKSNLGGKIALRVASAVNSRIILDQGGAERLFGKGDLLADLGQGLVRAQGAVLGGFPG